MTLSPDVVKDVSHGQQYGYKMVKAVTSGVLSMEMANCAIVLIDHSRWLTTATQFLRLWVSQHWDTGENLCRPREIIKFIVGVYSPMWFMINTRYSQTQGPHHVLQQLRYVRKMSPSVQALIGKYIKSSAWNAHSEAILLSLLVGSKEAR